MTVTDEAPNLSYHPTDHPEILGGYGREYQGSLQELAREAEILDGLDLHRSTVDMFYGLGSQVPAAEVNPIALVTNHILKGRNLRRHRSDPDDTGTVYPIYLDKRNYAGHPDTEIVHIATDPDTQTHLNPTHDRYRLRQYTETEPSIPRIVEPLEERPVARRLLRRPLSLFTRPNGQRADESRGPRRNPRLLARTVGRHSVRG